MQDGNKMTGHRADWRLVSSGVQMTLPVTHQDSKGRSWWHSSDREACDI